MDGQPRRLGLFFSVAVVGCALDLATKYWAFRELGLPGGRTHWIVDGIFGFQTSLNAGALFGMGQGMVWLFAALSVLAACGIMGWLVFSKAARDRWLTFALGSVLAGILGNLYDRLGLWADAQTAQRVPIHAVRDWILLQYQGHVWPNFNLADSFLVVGAAMLFWQAVRPAASLRELNVES